MQFAEQDQYVPLAKANDFFQAANATKQMKVYAGAAHDMVKPAAIMTDRDVWLTAELGLK
jgi:esterase/lipase